jgi:hypothetical protein
VTNEQLAVFLMAVRDKLGAAIDAVRKEHPELQKKPYWAGKAVLGTEVLVWPKLESIDEVYEDLDEMIADLKGNKGKWYKARSGAMDGSLIETKGTGQG